MGGYFLAQNLPLEAEKYYFESLKPQPGFYAFYDPMAGSIGLALAEIELKNYSDAEAIIRAIEPNAKGFDLENLSKIKLLMNQEKAKVLGHP